MYVRASEWRAGGQSACTWRAHHMEFGKFAMHARGATAGRSECAVHCCLAQLWSQRQQRVCRLHLSSIDNEMYFVNVYIANILLSGT